MHWATFRAYIYSRLKWLLTPHGPVRTMGTIAIAVFLGETLVMLLIAVFPPMSLWTEALVDAGLLIVVISPALYLFLFRPIIQHIRRRESAEADLRKSRDLLQTVFNGISEPLVLLDQHARVKMLNRAAESYYQIGDRPVLDLPCHQALMNANRQCPECDLPQQIEKNQTFTIERPGLFDTRRIEQVVVYRSRPDKEHIDSAILRITDITEARGLEQQMRQRERLASLGLLISGVAHEINNPNNFISFNIPILKEYLDEMIPLMDECVKDQPDFEISNMPYREFRNDLDRILENISHGSLRINAIVSKLKEFSRVHDAPKLEQVKIGAVLEKVVAVADSQIKRMVKRFEMRMAPDVPELVTDAHAVEQLVLNLLINACQASDPRKDSWLRLEVGPAPESSHALCIEVADNGSGMDEDTLKHIFDPLFTTKGPKSGTGLGLYICHNLAEALEGRIDVESVPGQGSTFRILLPDLRTRLEKTNRT